MAMFRGAADRVSGTVAQALRDQVAENLDDRVHEMLEAAVALWEQDGWTSHDGAEGDCTVQVYRWCRHLARHDRRFVFVSVQFEWVYVTPAMFAGTERVKSADRPDLRLEVGAVGRAIECKRLAPIGGWTRDYVYEGLARFVVGDYAGNEPVGYMIGYVQDGHRPELLKKINLHVVGHPSMGTPDQLHSLAAGPNSSWSRSSHHRESLAPILVDHLLVDVG
ncbi:MAG: hypothetical protein ACYDGN_12880 [Acidimicrobiales bacterium]